MFCRLSALTLAAALATGCNQYVLFNVAGYEQAEFSNEADVIFIVDNSSSMEQESESLGLNFNVFIEELTKAEDQWVTETLTDAVDNYITYTQQRGAFMDYQLAIGTTSVDFSGGENAGEVEPGEGGLLLGDPTVIAKGDDDVVGAFQANLLCDATCWNESTVPSDAGYTCGDDPGDTISFEYLDCVCGAGLWEDHCGAGQEEHLEAALLALCRAVDDPPEECWHATNEAIFSEDGDEILSNPDIIRDDSTIVIVIATDEGDDSRRLADGDSDLTEYTDAFDAFDRRIKFAAIGPPWDRDESALGCNSGNATTWGIERLQDMAELTGGFYRNIEEESASGDCELTDFATHLETLGELLSNLESAFQLQSVPDPTTILVFVDDLPIEQALPTDDVTDASSFGCDMDAELCNGWTYDSAQNAIVFWEPMVPDYNQDVRIYYRPLAGKPRDLPPL